MQAIVSDEPFKTSKNPENDEGESDSSDETGGEDGLADKDEENFDKTVEVVENMVDDPKRWLMFCAKAPGYRITIQGKLLLFTVR